MTREEIIALAIEAGDEWSSTFPEDQKFLIRFADLVVKAERQACAELVQVHMTAASIDLGVAICARGRK